MPRPGNLAMRINIFIIRHQRPVSQTLIYILRQEIIINNSPLRFEHLRRPMPSRQNRRCQRHQLCLRLIHISRCRQRCRCCDFCPLILCMTCFPVIKKPPRLPKFGVFPQRRQKILIMRWLITVCRPMLTIRFILISMHKCNQNKSFTFRNRQCLM